MIVAVCVDDLGGMMFNRRRVSRDRAVCADIVAMSQGKRLCMTEYSAKLFSEFEVDICTDARFLETAGSGDICFVEDAPLSRYSDKIESLVIYRWNRRYPSDMRLDISPAKSGFRLVSTEEFEGYSHEKITKETYAR